MTYNKGKHHRRSIRLKDYDYSSAGAYFVTICTADKGDVFGRIFAHEMQLNDFGEIAEGELLKSSKIRDELEIDENIIMPNHIHFIVWINNLDMNVGAHGMRPSQQPAKYIVGAPGMRPFTKTSPGMDTGANCMCPDSQNSADSARAHGRAPLQQCYSPKHGIAYRKPKSLGSFVAGYKSAVTKRINKLRKTSGMKLWQRGYYEHIIRDDENLEDIRRYIRSNPSNWYTDEYYLKRG